MFSTHVRSELLESFLEGLPSAFFVTDGVGRIVLANRRFSDWLAVPYEALQGRPQEEMLSAALRENLAATTAPRATAVDVTSEERSVTFPDGVTRWLVIRTFPVPHGDNGNSGMATVMTDRTEVRRIQEQLWQAQKMEAVGQLTGGVAHDFNNLLTVVLGNIEFACDLLDGDPVVGRHLKIAQRAAERGARLIQRLLAFSGQQQLQATATDVNQLMTEATEFARRTLPESITVSLDLDPALGRAMVDPAQLESAVLNLIVNARDALPDGGSLTLSTGSLLVTSPGRAPTLQLEPGAYAEVRVRDTGSGMPPHVARRIFEPFFTAKEKGKGTGLGLCMVQGFAKQSGGDIRIETAPGRGTEVTLYLPLAAAGADGRVAEAAAGPMPRDGGRILVVEDDPDVCQYVTLTLAGQGYAVRTAKCGEEAIDRLRETPIDLLFSDVVLPGRMNGVRLAEAALALCPDVRVLFGTGYADHALDRADAIDGAFDIIRKPYTRDALLKTVADLLSGKCHGDDYEVTRHRIAI